MTVSKDQWAVNILNNGGVVTIHHFTYRAEKTRYRLNRLHRDGVLERRKFNRQLEFRLKKGQPKLSSLKSKIKHIEITV